MRMISNSPYFQETVLNETYLDPYFFVPCTVIQLRNVNQQMHTFQINVLIQFLLSSACLEHPIFVIRKTWLYIQFYMVFLSCICAV